MRCSAVLTFACAYCRRVRLYAQVSGGPLYVSDHPGHHDFALLRRLVLPDGTILRCRGGPGRPTLDCLFADVMRDNVTLLKVGRPRQSSPVSVRPALLYKPVEAAARASSSSPSACCARALYMHATRVLTSADGMQVWNTNSYGAVVGVFNTQGASWDRARREFTEHLAPKAPLRAAVAPADVPALASASDARYVAWVDSVQTACVLTTYDSLHVTLARGQSDIITLLPLKTSAGIAIAPIGSPLLRLHLCIHGHLQQMLTLAPSQAS